MKKANGKIVGFADKLHLFGEQDEFVLDIVFDETSTLAFNNAMLLKFGTNEMEANAIHNRIKNFFENSQIPNEYQVDILYNDNRDVVAVAKSTNNDETENYEVITTNLWLDFRDFEIKSFEKLDIKLDS